jgi:hypothetical protein
MLIANILSAACQQGKRSSKATAFPSYIKCPSLFKKEKRERERETGAKGRWRVPAICEMSHTHTLSHNVKLAARQTETKKENKKKFLKKKYIT